MLIMQVMAEDDALWPQPDRVGRQELEIVIGDEHISFTTSKIGSLVDVNQGLNQNIELKMFCLLPTVLLFVLSTHLSVLFSMLLNAATRVGTRTVCAASTIWSKISSAWSSL